MNSRNCRKQNVDNE